MGSKKIRQKLLIEIEFACFRYPYGINDVQHIVGLFNEMHEDGAKITITKVKEVKTE